MDVEKRDVIRIEMWQYEEIMFEKCEHSTHPTRLDQN